MPRAKPDPIKRLQRRRSKNTFIDIDAFELIGTMMKQSMNNTGLNVMPRKRPMFHAVLYNHVASGFITTQEQMDKWFIDRWKEGANA